MAVRCKGRGSSVDCTACRLCSSRTCESALIGSAPLLHVDRRVRSGAHRAARDTMPWEIPRRYRAGRDAYESELPSSRIAECEPADAERIDSGVNALCGSASLSCCVCLSLYGVKPRSSRSLTYCEARDLCEPRGPRRIRDAVGSDRTSNS